MSQRILTSLLLLLTSVTSYAAYVGDINNDGKVTIQDVTLLVRMLSNNSAATVPSADVNGDGAFNKGDVDALITVLLSGKLTTRHEAVDLGLSVKWATCNLGADSPEQVGNYYAWGELTPKTDYSEATYLYYAYSEYLSIGSNICHTAYDAATATWGDDWKLPTLIDVNQLMKKCTWTETTQSGHKGYLVTGPNGNSIFLPLTGCRQGKELLDADTRLYYWCGQSSASSSAYCINNSGYSGAWSASRTYGFPIRPVRR